MTITTGGTSEEVLESLAAEVQRPHVVTRDLLTLVGYPGDDGSPIPELMAAYFEADARADEAYSRWLLSRSEENSQAVQQAQEALGAAASAFNVTLRRDVAIYTWGRGEGVEPELELKSSTYIESMCPVSYLIDREGATLCCASGTVIHTLYYSSIDGSVTYSCET